MSEPFSKVTTSSEEYKYSNIWIKWPSNIICICISTIFWVWIYSDIHSLYMWHSNIFRYLLDKLCGIRIYFNIRLCPFYDIRSLLVSPFWNFPKLPKTCYFWIRLIFFLTLRHHHFFLLCLGAIHRQILYQNVCQRIADTWA